MCAGRNILLVVLTVCIVFSAAGQKKTKSQLQKEKQQNVERIREVEKILGETTAKRKNTLGSLNALNQRIIEQQNLIASIRNEINLLNGEIRENNDIISVLDEDLRKQGVNGELWAVNTVNINGRSALRWYRINASTNALIEDGLISDPSMAYLYPSIAVNDLGAVPVGPSSTASCPKLTRRYGR